MSSINILVACHKQDPDIRKDEIYHPIHVGKALHLEADLGFQGDNTGDNISDKNPAYCELTALYWSWKNINDADFKGLAHYRRYFGISNEKLKEYLDKYDVILPKPVKQASNNFFNLVTFVGMEDSYIFLDTVLDLHPEMKEAAIDYFFNSNKYSVFNMLVARKEIFDEYCNFLFEVIEVTEKRIKKIDNYTRINRRIGYLAEAVMGMWFLHNKDKYKIKYVKTELTQQPKYNIKGKIYKLVTNNILKDLSFWAIKYPKRKKLIAWDAVKAGLKADNITLHNFQ